EAVVGQIRFRDEVTLVVARERILQALEAARDMGFRLLTDLTAVDRHPAQPRFDVVYLLTSVEPPPGSGLWCTSPPTRPRRRPPRYGRGPTGWNGRSSTCLASGLTAIPTCGAS